MKKLTQILLVAVVALMAVGCGTKVEIPTAHRGKISNKNGLQEGLIQPSKFRIFDISGRTSLILVDVADHPIEIKAMTVWIPEDEMNITVDLRGMLTVEEKNIDSLYAKIAPQQQAKSIVRTISWDSVYKTYGEPVLRSTVRSILTTNSIDSIMSNRSAVSAAIAQAVASELKASPLTLVRLDLADVQPPPVIVKAKEAAKEREVAIQQAEAQKEVALTEAQAALEVAKKQQEVELVEAETQVLVQSKLNEGVSDVWVTQRLLTVLHNVSTNNNKTMFLPLEFLRNPEMLAPLASKGIK